MFLSIEQASVIGRMNCASFNEDSEEAAMAYFKK
jgi:hypothetical protein